MNEIIARIRRYFLEHWLGPTHDHEEGMPCSCWEREGLRRPGAR